MEGHPTDSSDTFQCAGRGGCLWEQVTPEDWTKRKASEEDIQTFLGRLSAMRSGEKMDCPFCGGIVRMLSLKGEEAEFGCESCDMRIQTRVSSKSLITEQR